MNILILDSRLFADQEVNSEQVKGFSRMKLEPGLPGIHVWAFVSLVTKIVILLACISVA